MNNVEPIKVNNVEPTKPQTVKIKYAGFWKRFAAIIIDNIIMFIFMFSLGVFLVITGYTGTFEEFDNPIVNLIVGWLYFAGMESSAYQATFGKIVMGLIVTDTNNNRISFVTASIRFFGKIISIVVIFIGYIMIGFTEKKQGLHDMIAGCLVVCSDTENCV